MKILNNRETAILGLLFDQSMYGYEIEKIIIERNMRYWTEIGFSSIYYVLNRLEESGYVRSKEKLVEGRNRRIYAITRSGKKIIKEKISSLLSENSKLISPFELGIAFMHVLEPDIAISCLENYITSTLERLENIKELLRKSKEEKASYRKTALFERPIELVDADINWVKNFISDLQSSREFLRGE